jgi:hypothetical protein
MTEQAAAAAATQSAEWVAPEHHRCRHLHVSGAPCGATTRTGEKFCHTHQRWAETDPMYPIRVPLLEDPASIRFVMSQTVRALAMGTMPAANGRAILYGCRMAFDLLVHELAREKFRARQATGDRPQAAGSAEFIDSGEGVASEVTGDRLQVPATESAELPHPNNTGSDGAPGVVEDETSPENAGHRIVPRFPDLPEQWDQAVNRAAQEVARNVHRREDEDGESWMARQTRPIEAGHPSVRTGPARAAVAETRRRDLPFDPMCPPVWDPATMKDWPKEHMAAWFRAVAPAVSQLEVREFVRGMWDVPRADEKAGWPGRREGAAPQADCIFRKMRAEEIAAWVKTEIPDMPQREAKEYAEERLQGMEEPGRG